MFSLFPVVENLGCIIFPKDIQKKYLKIGYMLWYNRVEYELLALNQTYRYVITLKDYK